MKRLAKKLFSVFVVMLIIFCMNISAEAARKIVAIMPMENVSGYNAANVAQIMTEQLIATITNSGQYNVVERSQMASVMREQGFQNIASANSSELGQMSGADYTVVGKVTLATTTINPIYKLFASEPDDNAVKVFANKYKAKVELNVRFVDNKTGEVILADMFSGGKTGQNVEMSLAGACHEAAERILQRLQKVNPFAARIADISGDNIYIDQGVESGIRKGETLIVAREGSPIIVNGKIVDMKREVVCKAKVLEVNAEYSICKVDKASAVKKGDIVRRDSK